MSVDIGQALKDAGNDLTNGAGDSLKDLQKTVNNIITRLEEIEKKSNSIINKVEDFGRKIEDFSKKIIKKIEDFTEKIGEIIYRFFRDKIKGMIVIVLIILLFPHIMALLNFSTNLMILFKAK